MKYFNESDLKSLPSSWTELVNLIEEAIICIQNNEYNQPIKPYVRFEKNSKNRIIAMPSYLGGKFDVAGLKWIASFPDNLSNGIPRAHSISILNDSNTGIPLAFFSSAYLSRLRTASVSGLCVKRFLNSRSEKLIVGIIGMGPIGITHFEMLTSLFGDKIKLVKFFDVKKIDLKNLAKSGSFTAVEVCNSWKSTYENSDIVITCTTASKGYINISPKDNSLHLNVSLRDYDHGAFQYMTRVIVDDWEEVSREGTDIHRETTYYDLKKSDTISFADFFSNRFELAERDNVIINPMGLSVFDVAISKYFYDLGCQHMIGLTIDL